MKENFMNNPNEEFVLKLRPRPQEKLSLDIPTETLVELKKVANSKDMSVEALVKFYIGQALRQDLTNLFSHRVLEVTAQVLS